MSSMPIFAQTHIHKHGVAMFLFQADMEIVKNANVTGANCISNSTFTDKQIAKLMISINNYKYKCVHIIFVR